MTRILSSLAAAAVCMTVAGAAGAVEQRPMLTIDMAIAMADACEAEAIEQGWRPVIIAIFDDGGNLKHFKRMDGSFLGSIEIAQLKGHTAAIFPRSTRARGELAYGGERPHGIELVPGIVVFPGGLPIIAKDGHQVGGIGVSGATSDQDEQCAQAAIDAVADRL